MRYPFRIFNNPGRFIPGFFIGGMWIPIIEAILIVAAITYCLLITVPIFSIPLAAKAIGALLIVRIPVPGLIKFTICTLACGLVFLPYGILFPYGIAIIFCIYTMWYLMKFSTMQGLDPSVIRKSFTRDFNHPIQDIS